MDSIKRKEKRETVAFRAPLSHIEAVRSLCQWERQRGNAVTEADVYRHILALFIESQSTKRNQETGT